MTQTERTSDIHDYFEIALRRKWYIIILFILSMVCSFGIYKNLPKVYRATTVILVQPQKIPEDYVRPTTTQLGPDRLNTITQEILSRSRLEQVIREMNIYPQPQINHNIESAVVGMRKAIEIKMHSGQGQTLNSFTISYYGPEPKTVMLVTNRLASLFIEENSMDRELRAERTSQFLSKEMLALEEQLRKKEDNIRHYKQQYMGQLPQQLEANLRIHDRLHQELQAVREGIRAAEEKLAFLKSKMEEFKQSESLETSRLPAGGSFPGEKEMQSLVTRDHPLVKELMRLQGELANARLKYKENHPDIAFLQKQIAKVSQEVKELNERMEAEAKLSKGQEGIEAKNGDPDMKNLPAQYTEQYKAAQQNLKRSREEENNLKEQISVYLRRIEDAPQREQEIIGLTRDYNRLEENYQLLLNKKIQAQIGEKLERTQQGEQFKILDPARLPESPIKPNRQRILLMGALVGLAIGFGLAWVRESLDQSFHKISDLEDILELPVLALLPNMDDERGFAR